MNPCAGHRCDGCATCLGGTCCGRSRGDRTTRPRSVNDAIAIAEVEVPARLITFVLSDIEASTAIWDREPEAMARALERHDRIFEELIEAHCGVHVRPRGEGDSRFAVFVEALDAVTAGLEIQRAFAVEDWPTRVPLMVRIGIHTGEAHARDGDYYGPAVNRCARVRSLARGGQILLSEATTSLVRDVLPPGARLRDLGRHRLRGLIKPERVAQVLHPDLVAQVPSLVGVGGGADLCLVR
jgi:class 3 adenylate cyclase